MNKPSKKFVQQINALALSAVMLDPKDIPALGRILKSLESALETARQLDQPDPTRILHAMKGYLERVILGETEDLGPFEAALSQLQEIIRVLQKGKEFKGEIAPLLVELGSGVDNPREKTGKDRVSPDGEKQKSLNDHETARLTDEDREIIADFVSESLENLSTIEVGLMDLEQDPSNPETINGIFRPFHTIKGVSGFLNFNRINALAHKVENLLDKARKNELNIDGQIVDVILDSVDLLKRMIENVRISVAEGVPCEGNVDPDGLTERINAILRGSKRPLGEILLENGAVERESLEEALSAQEKYTDRRIGEILVSGRKAGTREVLHALREQKRYEGDSGLQVKVDTGKLDSIVDMVGELAIAQSMLRQNDHVMKGADRKLHHIINQLNQITSALQRTSMSLRMVPIKHTFQKMLRLVRDLSHKAGKEVRLLMSGEDTEIDRIMVEEIYEPMVHMMRNAIDHGLEPPEERETAGKPRCGTVQLRAYHKGGSIVIEIADDGRGLNREKILKKALSLELVNNGEKLTDAEINNLIFQPGFSTAEKITDISGRGVGTDVVKSKIERLRGRVDVESVPGKGATFYLRLPLTLAIVDGMIVKVAGERYIIPTLAIQESFKPRREDCHSIESKGEVVVVRDSLVPLIRLDRLFGLSGNGKDPWERLVVVVESQERRVSLLVDELVGQEEIVIKSLGGWLKDVKGLAGGAIMGDGRVGLILDISGIVNVALGES